MPVHYSTSSSKSNKSKGFSIDDLIQNDPTLKTVTPLPHPTSYLPSMVGWFPTPNTMLHFQRQSMLHYLRQTPNFARRFSWSNSTKNRLFFSFVDSDPATTAFLLNSFRKPKRNRTAFTPAQLLKLEDAFEKNHYIVGEERKQLARLLNLSETKVSVLLIKVRWSIEISVSLGQSLVSESSYKTKTSDCWRCQW